MKPITGGHGPRAPHHHWTQDPIWTTPVSPLTVRFLEISKATEAYVPLIIRAKTSDSKWLTLCVHLYRCGFVYAAWVLWALQMACIACLRRGQFSKCLKIRIIAFEHIVVFSLVQPYDCLMATRFGIQRRLEPANSLLVARHCTPIGTNMTVSLN